MDWEIFPQGSTRVAYLVGSIQQGHRIRIALAGANKDHFQNLDGPAPIWEIWHTPDHPSHIELPVVR